jgi:hypothetical protein
MRPIGHRHLGHFQAYRDLDTTRGEPMNTTDRELLELAAKAAGFAEFNPDPTSGKYNVGPATKADGALEDGHWLMWNPLTDDGDALRLAVKLYLWEPIRLAHRDVSGNVDMYAATRRAIVRAAAAIGKAMLP